VAIVKEDVDSEVSDFKEACWQEADIFMDEDMEFFKALYDGELRSIPMYKVLPGLLWTIMTGAERPWEKLGGNLNGEGLIQGGLMIVGKHGNVIMHKEGDQVKPEEVLQVLQGS